MIELLNCDCMEYMATVPDKYFDLAIVDPPYGINWTKTINYSEKQKIHQNKKGYKTHSVKEWDSAIPTAEYWSELFRVSKNQIVWGANYMTEFLPPSRCWIVWDKKGENFTAINNELAWTSFESRIKIFSRFHGMDKGFMNKDGGGIHPTEKPVALYEWLLTNYAKKGQRVFDSHGGSMSSVIAAINCGCSIVCCELDADYFAAGVERVRQHQNQFTLFNDENVIIETKPTTNDIFA